jgi:hypothetical protein
MKKTLLIGTLTATLLASGAAFAAGTTNADKCNTLTTQWHEIAQTHKSNAKFPAALKEADSGIKMCKANSPTGIQSLDKALNMLGVKPNV